ncbi:D-hexose-6-phosphate mutarotase [Rheinheimera sp. UJ63]|uniref:D-hexose-6-phosphate mutarotase n=1 Tax=Rheinheimera sp. UJ63 TaxID=2910157 RepID=UPI001F3DE66B|nr:D-hexose-6-phosphate mutarotase [Rheinheimera sp. UJ63]MCF4009901.1 D-hexose-6-phosphate mutarotase [Rheinheimera sp. UJ63]
MSIASAQLGFAHLTDLPCYRLQFQQASLVVSLYGGHLLSYQPQPGQETLWLSPLASWHQQQPLRGGVPICWPWFGPIEAKLNPEQQAVPNHGLVRNRMWTFIDSQAHSDFNSLTLNISIDDMPGHRAKTLSLTLCLRLYADKLSITLECDEPLLQQAALHSYFQVPSLSACTVQGLGQRFIDKVRQQQHFIEADPVVFNQEIDRVYLEPAAQLSVQSGQYQLLIDQQGHDSTVLWNPAAERSKAMADLPDHGYQEFVCVETAQLQMATPSPLQLTQTLQLTKTE